jgi:hypothetical protein
MSTSPSDLRLPFAQDVSVTDDALVVELVDGRTISIPLAWYPRLVHATAEERSHWRFIGRGEASTGRISTRTSALPDSSPGGPRASRSAR